jgi:hypothetical protein
MQEAGRGGGKAHDGLGHGSSFAREKAALPDASV